MTPEERIDFVEGVLGDWADAGLTVDEMTKAAKVVADELERREAKGESLDAVLKEAREKVGFDPTAWFRNLSQGLKNTTTTGLVLGGGLLGGAGLGGYYGAKAVAGLADDEEEQIDEIKRRELIDTLREHAALARLRNRQRESSGGFRLVG